MLKRKIFDSYFTFASEFSVACGTNQRIESVPINFMKPIYGKYNHNFRDFPAPGFILT